MKYKIVPKAEAVEWVSSLHTARPSVALGVLLAGDRWSCVDEVVLATTVFGDIVGIATMAFRGEWESGESTIVAVYVLPDRRGHGIGYKLFETAIDYMLSREFETIRVDAMNSKVSRMIDHLPIEKRQKLNVVVQSFGGMVDAMMES